MKQSDDSLRELRELLLGNETEQLANIQSLLNDPENMAKIVGASLPEAILIRNTQDEKMSKVLMPTIEDAIKTSVARDPGHLVEAISPVMGPSIRRAIAETFRSMIKNFNQALENSFSLRGLKWRWEAIRTGSSFAEVVMLHSLVYRVEQVFLVHRETGIPVQHLVADDVTAQDGDMVSGMLTAIQDFAHDSFQLEATDNLESFQVGELHVVIEPGRGMYLAAVIRGEPPQELLQIFRDTMTQINLLVGDLPDQFDGDSSRFDLVNPLLHDCLVRKLKASKKRFSLKFWLISFLIVLLIGWGIFNLVQIKSQWSKLVDHFKNEPGYHVTSVEHHWGQSKLKGFRDPLSQPPEKILAKNSFDSEKVDIIMEHYYALSPEFVTKRMNHWLAPPDSVETKIDNGILHVSGEASHEWIEYLQTKSRHMPGIHAIEFDHLVDLDKLRLKDSLNTLQQMFIEFDIGSDIIREDQSSKIDESRLILQQIQQTIEVLDGNLTIEIQGHTDISGTEKINSKLSINRAFKVRDALRIESLDRIRIMETGLGSTLHSQGINPGTNSLRFVGFRVVGKLS